MAKVIASGPAPVSRGARLGEILGNSLGEGISRGYETERALLNDIEQFNPVREALATSLEGQPLTAGQRVIQSMVQDPRQFARFMSNPQAMHSTAGAMALAAPPQEETFPTLEEINATIDRIDAARAGGETRRVEALEARLRDLTGMSDIKYDHDLVQRRLPSGEYQTLWSDSDRKLFYDMSGQPVSLTPEDVVIESATLTGGAADLLPPTESTRLRDARTTGENFVATVGDALQMLEQNPDVATWTGSASAFINDMQQEGIAAMRNLGIEFDPDALDPSTNGPTFDELGIENRQWRSLIQSLAFRAAAAEASQTGRAVSNEDVKRFIDIIGGSGSDPRAIARTMTDVANRVVRDYQTSHRNRLNEEFEGDFGLSQLPQIGGDQDGGTVTYESVETVNGADIGDLDTFIANITEADWNALPAEVKARIAERVAAGE